MIIGESLVFIGPTLTSLQIRIFFQTSRTTLLTLGILSILLPLISGPTFQAVL
jgi:hypothetical protein